MDMALTMKDMTVVATVFEPINGMIKKQAVEIKNVMNAGTNKLFAFLPVRPASKAPLI